MVAHVLFQLIFIAISQAKYTDYLRFYKLGNGSIERLSSFLNTTQ